MLPLSPNVHTGTYSWYGMDKWDRMGWRLCTLNQGFIKYHRSWIMYFLNAFSFESSNCKWHLLLEVQTFDLILQIYVIKLKKFKKGTQTKFIKIYVRNKTKLNRIKSERAYFRKPRMVMIQQDDFHRSGSCIAFSLATPIITMLNYAHEKI